MPQYTGYPRKEINAADAQLVVKAQNLLRQGMDHRQTKREMIWKLVKLQYEGAHWSEEAKEDPTANLTVVNMSFATIQTIKPYITDREPRFYLEPFSSDATRLSAALQEVFLNRMWRHPPVGAQPALRRAAFDYLTYGDGFLKGTYTTETRTDSEGEETVHVELHVDRVSPWDVYIDPYALGFEDARWVAHRVWMTQEEAEADERLKIPSDYQFGDRTIEEGDDSRNRTNVGLEDAQQWVQLIEFHDIANGVTLIYPAHGASNDTKGEGIKPWAITDDMTLPLVQLPNYDIDDSPWHMGELENITDLQKELNRTRSELLTHRQRNVSKVFIREGILGEGASEALQSPIVNEMVFIKGQEPLANVVVPFQVAPLTADNYQASQEIKDDIREITGITEYQRGVAPEITRTATEASIMDAAANTKLQSKLTAIEEASRKLGSILLGISREIFPQTDVDEWAMFIGGDEAQRLARMAQGQTASEQYEAGDVPAAIETMNQQLPTDVQLKPTDQMFTGDYEVLVEVGSTEYRDPKMRQERLEQMFFSLVEVAPMLSQMGVNVDMGRMARLWLESTDIIDVDSLLTQAAPQPPGPPQEQLPPEMAGAMPLPPGAIPEAMPQPFPEEMAGTGNTGMLDTGQIAPAVPGYGEVS